METPDHTSRSAAFADALLELHGRAAERWSSSARRRFGLVVVLVAAVVATAGTLALSNGSLPHIDVIPYLSLVLACWIGAGGLLVPVPGARPLSWVMIVHQSVVLDPLFVAGLSALAMALGQTSLFIAAEHGAQHHRARKERRHGHERQHTAPPRDAGTVEQGEEQTASVGRAQRARTRVATTSRRATDGLKRHPMGSVLLLSFIPSPLTSAASSAAGAAGMPFSRFFLSSLGGFLSFVVLLVVLGAGLLALFGIATE